ncbi:hypothetical protein [Conexibacter woesei]|uniref:hypothetical protein n=1 Tax=Conexibacter woesei TaxID=191495 RepID=UPI000427A2B2|nr:hypothetical protein [Conexibacter woesei]
MSSEPRQTVGGAAGRRPAGLLTSTLPIMVGVGAGAIYATGAIATLAQFLRSGVGAEEIFPQVPIAQHLARGLEYLMQPATFVAVFVLTLAFAWESRVEASIGAALRSGSRRRHVAELAVVAVLAIVVFLPTRWLAAILIAAGVTLLVAITLTLVLAQGAGGDRPLTLLLLTFTVAFLLADAFVSPTPLPKVTLTDQNGQHREGVLLLRTDAGWFVVSGTGYEDVPADRVVSATVVGGHEHHGRSLFSRLF